MIIYFVKASEHASSNYFTLRIRMVGSKGDLTCTAGSVLLVHKCQKQILRQSEIGVKAGTKVVGNGPV